MTLDAVFSRAHLIRAADVMPKLKTTKKAQPAASSELLAGLELQGQNRLDEAEMLFRFVLKDDATNWRALHQLGAIYLTRGQYVEALQYLGAAMKSNARSAEVTSNYGVVLRKLRRDDEAIEYFNRALMLKPGYVPAILTRGTSFHHLGRREEALASFDRVIEIDPTHARAHYNRANVLHELKRFKEAIESFGRAIALAPENADAHWNESLAHLLTGDYREGWKQYEWRWKRGNLQPRDFKQPLWLGEESVAGKTILVHAEQGFGDTLQCARYIPLLAKNGATVVLEVQPALKALFRSLEGVSTLLSRGEPLPAFDLHCPIMSLPLAFKTELSTIPANVPYLSVPKDRVEKWQRRVPQGKKLTIAFAWTGSPGNEENDIRSIPLSEFAPLFADENIQWISIQRDLTQQDSELLNNHLEVKQFGAELSDFADTSAIIAQADLVISVCTSAAHLAGALSRPFWLLSKHSPDFRWLLDRDDSPWYPSARIFRQPTFGDWGSVIARVKIELQNLRRSD